MDLPGVTLNTMSCWYMFIVVLSIYADRLAHIHGYNNRKKELSSSKLNSKWG